jgi:hypothetical protein
MDAADSQSGGNGVLPTWVSSSKPGSRARGSRTEIDGAVWWQPTLDELRAAKRLLAHGREGGLGCEQLLAVDVLLNLPC